MRGRSGSAPPIGVSGAASVLPALALGAGEEEDESARRRNGGRSGSPEGGGLLEAGELLGDEEESVVPELPLVSRPLKCGRPAPAFVNTSGLFLPCFGLARLGGAAMGFHAP